MGEMGRTTIDRAKPNLKQFASRMDAQTRLQELVGNDPNRKTSQDYETPNTHDFRRLARYCRHLRLDSDFERSLYGVVGLFRLRPGRRLRQYSAASQELQ